MLFHDEINTKDCKGTQKSDYDPPLSPVFGEKEGKIAKSNRNRDPLYLFAALQRHLNYPEVPHPHTCGDLSVRLEVLLTSILEAKFPGETNAALDTRISGEKNVDTLSHWLKLAATTNTFKKFVAVVEPTGLRSERFCRLTRSSLAPILAENLGRCRSGRADSTPFWRPTVVNFAKVGCVPRNSLSLFHKIRLLPVAASSTISSTW